MKKLGKILLWRLITLVVLLVVAISLTIGWRPFIGPRARPLTSRQFERTPQRLERGRYLFTSSHRMHRMPFAARLEYPRRPVLPGGEGVGQVMWFKDLPGPHRRPEHHFRSGNRRGQLDRRSTGARHPGRHRLTTGGHLFPMMPYQDLGICRMKTWPR